MLNRLILKVTKFQPPLPKSLGTVVKNILGAIMPPMSNRLNPAVQGNLKMIRHIAGSGPLYIRSMPDKRSENDSSSNEDSDRSDNECEDVSKTTLPSLRRIMTIDLDNSSKNAVSNLSESADKIEPNPFNFDKNRKEKI